MTRVKSLATALAGRRRWSALASGLAVLVSAGIIVGLFTAHRPLPVGDDPGSQVEEMSDTDLLGLLTTRAETPMARDTCAPEGVEARLVGYQVAAGHRFTSLRVRNVSRRPCVLGGVPGIGVRGQSGSKFVPVVEPEISCSDWPRCSADANSASIVLAPGQEAGAVIEWTDALAGVEDERVSGLIIQFAKGQVPIQLAARIDGDPADAEPLDIGPSTTIRVGSFNLVERSKL